MNPNMKSGYIDHGSIEGYVEIIGGQHFVRDELTGDLTRCEFQPLHLGDVDILRRVCLTGDISYCRETRKPLVIFVQGLRWLRSLHELPQLDSLTGINITGKMSSEDYVRMLREG